MIYGIGASIDISVRSVLRESRPGFPARGHDSESKRLVVHNSTFKSFETLLPRGRLRPLNQPENRRDQTVTSVVVAWHGRMTFPVFQVGKLGH